MAAALLASAGPVAANATDAARIDMRLREGRLSADVVAAPFAKVLAEIARLSGAGVTGFDPADVAPTTVAFSDLPLAEALERLLQGRSHLVVYGSDAPGAGVRRIVLLDGGKDAPVPPADASPAAPQAAASVPDQADPVLADALDLLTSALALGDTEIRRQLLDEVATWQLDAPARAILLARLSGDPDAEVREAALGVLQAGRPDVSSMAGVRERGERSPARRAPRERRGEGRAA